MNHILRSSVTDSIAVEGQVKRFEMANENLFDDSSDLEDSWAGEDVTFDPSPASSECHLIRS